MYNSNIPSDRELPSTQKLIKSTVLAIIGAGILLVTVVMPAEYAIDPTGFGRLTGLQQMGTIRGSLAQEAAQEVAVKAAPPAQETVKTIPPAQQFVEAVKPKPAPQEAAVVPQNTNSVIPTRKDTVTFTLAPNESAEIKATMQKEHKVNYEWTSTGKVNFDNHADSKELNIKYHAYTKGIAKERDAGVINAAFNGQHGWFWRNRTKEKVTITLVTHGEYSEIVRAD